MLTVKLLWKSDNVGPKGYFTYLCQVPGENGFPAYSQVFWNTNEFEVGTEMKVPTKQLKDVQERD